MKLKIKEGWQKINLDFDGERVCWATDECYANAAYVNPRLCGTNMRRRPDGTACRAHAKMFGITSPEKPNMNADTMSAILTAVRVAEALHPRAEVLPNGTGGAGRPTYETIARNACERATAEGRLTHCHIFEEEVTEVMAATEPGHLKKELFDVIAACVRWIADIEKAEVE